MHLPAGSLLAGAAALCLTAAVAVGANPDPQEATEIDPVDAQLAAQATDKLGDHFIAFAGSEANAAALVTGLHNGTAISLATTAGGQTTTTTFMPTTGAMGYRNVFVSLAVAEAQLTALGITQPTAAEIQAALDGGSVTTGSGTTATTTKLTGVLVLRNQGQNWSQISQSLGVNLHSALASARAATDAAETAEAGQAGEAGSVSAGARVTDRLGDRFATFAGGEANATALVTGLRNGTAITLTSTVNGQTTTTTFTPTTGAMGYGNVALSLNMAEQQLAKLGITQPTAAEIQAALDGGSVTTGSGTTAVTTALTGVLVLRSQGQGWGQIAQTLGVTFHPGDHEGLHVAGVESSEATETSESNEAASKATVAKNAIAAAGMHPDTAASAHTNLASMAHPEVPSISARPDLGAAAAASAAMSARPEIPHVPRFERPEIPSRPMIPGHG